MSNRVLDELVGADDGYTQMIRDLLEAAALEPVHIERRSRALGKLGKRRRKYPQLVALDGRLFRRGNGRRQVL